MITISHQHHHVTAINIIVTILITLSLSHHHHTINNIIEHHNAVAINATSNAYI